MNREYQVWDREGEDEEDWIRFYHFANSYKKAFETLIAKEVLGQEAIYGDEDILPILNVFSHYLELIFKSMLLKKGKLEKTHDLKRLLDEVEKEYPDIKFSSDSKLFMYGGTLTDPAVRTLDYARLKYPIDKNQNKFWIVHDGLDSFLNLVGIHKVSHIIINEIEDHLKSIDFLLKK